MSVTPLADAWRYDGGDPGLVVFGEALKAWRFDLPEGARVLELGCCESDWAKVLLKARPDAQVIGIDVRPCPDYPGVFVQADAAEHVWDTDVFDAVFAIGSIEHFGLGWHEYGDPLKADADADAILKAGDALALGGVLYFDVPYTPDAFFQTAHWRCYNDAALSGRLALAPVQHLRSWRLQERARGWAPNEAERGFTQVRPLVPHQPFYFTARWLTKVA